MWLSHVTHINESRHTYDWVTSQDDLVAQVAFIEGQGLLTLADMLHSENSRLKTSASMLLSSLFRYLNYTAKYCTTLQHAATRCSTLFKTVIQYPCLRVYVAQIHVDVNSQFLSFCRYRTDDFGIDSITPWPTELVSHCLRTYES